MRLVNRTRGTVLATQLRVADSFFSRLKGLLGTNELPAGAALLIRPCHDIHMFGMKYSIDVAFVNATDQVKKTVFSLAPGKMASCKEASYVVEMPCGTLRMSKTEPGDRLEVVNDLS